MLHGFHYFIQARYLDVTPNQFDSIFLIDIPYTENKLFITPAFFYFKKENKLMIYF